jgi:acyl-CoA reductase-like NAD-dependent aldehyde dehydrogenase
VVGAGSAGAIVARRLAETGASVVLLEAGNADKTRLVRKPGLMGRARPDLGPAFYEPTVLEGVTTEMLAGSCETFGPVVALRRYRDVDEAVARPTTPATGSTPACGARTWLRLPPSPGGSSPATST